MNTDEMRKALKDREGELLAYVASWLECNLSLTLNEIDRLRDELTECVERTKEACFEAGWCWIITILKNGKDDNYQKKWFKQAINEAKSLEEAKNKAV